MNAITSLHSNGETLQITDENGLEFEAKIVASEQGTTLANFRTGSGRLVAVTVEDYGDGDVVYSKDGIGGEYEFEDGTTFVVVEDACGLAWERA